jgi:hypothetical protein
MESARLLSIHLHEVKNDASKINNVVHVSQVDPENHY